jgi:UDP-N-acetyl-2-amino-2-deoxyglucuronate dehydrogenase
MTNFALIGAAGYVAPRHLEAIRDTGNMLLAAADPHDSVGVLDRYFPSARYFAEIERFDRHLEKLRRGPAAGRVDWVSICSPNFLHDAHVRLALRVGANAICEKPLVISPWNLDQLAAIEADAGRRVYTVLQLRLHPDLVALKQRLTPSAEEPGSSSPSPGGGGPGRGRRDVVLTYVTGRGPWYHVSWKGLEERSGGLAMNIGVHLFDLLLWLFGPADRIEVHQRTRSRVAGFLELKGADVRWLLSVEMDDLPQVVKPTGQTTHRSIAIDGEEVEFSGGFDGLHTRVYEQALAGNGFGIEDARPSTELVQRIRQAELVARPSAPHPHLVTP